MTHPLYQQQTLSRPVTMRGLSLFHGYDTTLTLLPAEADTGIVFQRTDLAEAPAIPARHNFVLPAQRRTVLGHSQDCRVETTEHLLAALAGLRVDNCRIEINTPETPAVDHSCRPFCDAILDAGLTQQGPPARQHRITMPRRVVGKAPTDFVELLPSRDPGTRFSYCLDYGGKSEMPLQQCLMTLTPEAFLAEVAPARTYVFEQEIAGLRALGFGSHLQPGELLVLDCRGNPVESTLRFPNECARHKLLDCLGDLMLCGARILGEVRAVRSGHQLNHQAAAAVCDAAGFARNAA